MKKICKYKILPALIFTTILSFLTSTTKKKPTTPYNSPTTKNKRLLQEQTNLQVDVSRNHTTPTPHNSPKYEKKEIVVSHNLRL